MNLDVGGKVVLVRRAAQPCFMRGAVTARWVAHSTSLVDRSQL